MKISRTHHRTKDGIVKRNPRKSKRYGLPTTVLIPKNVSEKTKENNDAITDYLSDRYGFCVFGFDDKKIGDKHYAFNIEWDEND
jgi:hypothetical protein